MLAQSPLPSGTLRENVTSKGRHHGPPPPPFFFCCTGSADGERNGFRPLLRDAVAAAKKPRRRAFELIGISATRPRFCARIPYTEDKAALS